MAVRRVLLLLVIVLLVLLFFVHRYRQSSSGLRNVEPHAAREIEKTRRR
jgi:hypothetical protein